MRKVMLTTLLCGVISGVAAESNVCHYSTDYNINVVENGVIFSKSSGEKLEFAGNNLLINNKQVGLDDKQIKASVAFEKNARQMVPQIAEIAVDGMELGLKTTSMVMAQLFADDVQVQKDLIQPIERLSLKLKQNINHEFVNVEALETSIEKAFDEEFAQLIETAVTKYSGKIMGNVLSSVLSGDSEELEDLEFRMENLEHNIEKYVEDNAGGLKVRAEQLCDQVAELDKLDETLRGVEGYPKEGLIQKNSKKGFKFSTLDIKFD